MPPKSESVHAEELQAAIKETLAIPASTTARVKAIFEKK